MVSFLSLPWNGRDPVSISNCGDTEGAQAAEKALEAPCCPGDGARRGGGRAGTAGQAALTMSTPKDHQSALCVWPRRFTTSGAMYSMVPQKE